MNIGKVKLDHKTTLLTPLFLNESARAVSVSFLSFFSAIYIYKRILLTTGDEKLAFLVAFAFFAILYLFKILSTFLAENLTLTLGLKKQVVFGNLLTIATLFAFLFSSNNFSILFLAAIFWGAAVGFFWFGHHGLLAKVGCRGEYGEAIGWGGIINSLAVSATPFLGGFLVSHFSYQILFLASLAILLLGFWPLVNLTDETIHHDAQAGEIFKLLLTHKRMSLVYFSLGAVGVIYSLALLFVIYLSLGKELSFGGFFSLSMLLVAIVNFAIGRWTDKNGKKKLLSYGAFLSGLVWFVRFFTLSLPVLFLLDVTDRIAGGMVGIPLLVLTLEKALDGHSTGRAILFREIAIGLGEISGVLMLMIIILLGFSLQTSFLIAGVLMLTPFLVIEKS